MVKTLFFTWINMVHEIIYKLFCAIIISSDSLIRLKKKNFFFNNNDLYQTRV